MNSNKWIFFKIPPFEANLVLNYDEHRLLNFATKGENDATLSDVEGGRFRKEVSGV